MEVVINKQVIEIEAMVGSESTEGAYYRVELLDGCWSCTCPSFKFKELECKHIKEVRDRIDGI